MNKWLVFTVIFTAFANLNVAFAGADIAAGKAKAGMCAGCHGAMGTSSNAIWPNLAGQHAEYLAKQLTDFKAGKRTDATMAPMVAGLSEQDIENLAAFYASQSAPVGAADESLMELGEKIYRGGNAKTGVSACIACHGPKGEGNSLAKFPSISGQHAAYTEIQLKAFQKGERSNDANKTMRNTTMPMTEAEIKAVASYVQGLH